jgi:hypothetical protein
MPVPRQSFGRQQGPSSSLPKFHQPWAAGGPQSTQNRPGEFPPFSHHVWPGVRNESSGPLNGADPIYQLVSSLQQFIQQLCSQMEVEREESRRRQHWLEARISDLEGQHRSPPRTQRWPSRPVWPTPTPSEDTPEVNDYLERSAQLDEALKAGECVVEPGARCRFVEHVGDLCEAPEPIKVHAVAADLRCGIGVAASVIEAAGERPKCDDTPEIGDIVKQEADGMGTIYHLVTKERSPHKFYKRPEPFLVNVKKAFAKLADTIRSERLADVAMSYVCSGTDRLHRLWVMEQLHDQLKDIPVTIHFYNKFESKRWLGAGKLFEGVPQEPPSPAPEAVTPSPSKKTKKNKGKGKNKN